MYCLGVVALTLPGMRLPNTKKGTPGTPASRQPRASKSSSHGGDAADGHPRVKNDRLAEPVFFSASVLYTRVTIWRRTLAARTKMLGEAHPDTAEAMRELALALRSSRATEYRREGLALDQKLKMLSAKPQAEKQPRTRPQARQPPNGVVERGVKPAMRSKTPGITALVRLPLSTGDASPNPNLTLTLTPTPTLTLTLALTLTPALTLTLTRRTPR